MAREIKFRAWDKEEKEYYYDVEDTYDYRCSGRGCYADSFGEVLAHPERYEVEQYTGLKDKNGKEIYEGDILHIHDHILGDFVVVWHNLSWTIKRTVGYESLRVHKSEDCTVIGNIHENQELLKEGGKNGKSKV